MAKLEAQTVWTVTDEDDATATVEINRDEDRLEIGQGGDLIYLKAEAIPQVIAALQEAFK